ncbi:hypothetical protein ODZ83_05450 [Acaricomes phytoseiuli]|uniref:hypothetical protein n=1 Tax=Acaricomes phytoseiuli TaxID=291968 RepID=UPI0022214425|nr:hypothetical protein [Acaricomes phytoseiuli]MCW1249636.1 hypothetical protein [Acaricomes phytoseiuli]
MSEVFNPASVEQAIAGLSNRIAKGVGVCNTAYRAFQDAQHALDLAEARAYMAFDGPAHEKKYAATLAVEEERRTRDLAEAAYRHADRQSRALQGELMAMQSVNKSVLAMWSAAGTVER